MAPAEELVVNIWLLHVKLYSFMSGKNYVNHRRDIVYRQLRARRALLKWKNVPLRTRRALLLYKVYGDSALLVLNGNSLICNNALLALNWRYNFMRAVDGERY